MASTAGDNQQSDSRNTDFEENAGAAAGGSSSGSNSSGTDSSVNMEFLLDISLEVTVELGRTKMLINDMLKLGQGSVIELTKLAGESLEILANQKPIARGEVVVVNEKYGVRLTEVISPMERIERLR
jgi:flagellar motor switch protein FliN/FliY